MDKEEAQIIRMAANIMMDELLMPELAPSLTCGEAEILARLIELALGSQYSVLFLREHARGDEDPEDQHHQMYLAQ